MRKTSKRLRIAGLILLLVAGIPGLVWVSLTHQPGFYRAMVRLPRGERAVKARRFMAQSLQLRNDICNEPTWEAIFTDEEVNAWLSEDLVTHFADQLPPEVHEPRVVFELDRVTLAFQLDSGPFSSVIWVVARPRVPRGNVVELTLEKIRAGVLPVPPDTVLDRITAYVRDRGLDVRWRRGDEGFPVVTLRYTPDTERDDVELELVQIQQGQIRLAGRSSHARGIVRSPKLPTRKVLQSKFPRRKFHARADSAARSRTGSGSGSGTPAPTLHNATTPTS
jgi:hypothetical protein